MTRRAIPIHHTNIAFVVGSGSLLDQTFKRTRRSKFLNQVSSRPKRTTRILHDPAVLMNSAPNTDSEVDTATLSTGEPGPTVPGREFPKLFADIVCEQARQLSLPVFKDTVKNRYKAVRQYVHSSINPNFRFSMPSWAPCVYRYVFSCYCHYKRLTFV